MGQTSSTKNEREQQLQDNYEKYQGLFTKSELEEINQTYQAICQNGGDETGKDKGFSLSQLQNFIGEKLPASVIQQLYKQLRTKNKDLNNPGICRNAFVTTVACLMKGTLEEQGQLLFTLVLNEEADAMSVGQVSDLISSMLKSYEEALKTLNRMNGWDLTSTPEADQKFIDLVLEFFSSDGKSLSSDAPVSREDFVRWLQQTPLVQQVFADVFHLCFAASPNSSATGPSIPDTDTDTSVLHHLPTLPLCLNINWSKLKSQLNIPSLLLINHHVPHHLRDQWRFLYSSAVHGASFATLLSHLSQKGPTVLLVQDTQGHVFGGFASDSWEIKTNYFGSSRCFLFSLAPKVGIYEASGKNDNYMYLNIDQQTLPNGLGMGGQFDYFGLWIDQEFGQGHSRARPKCTTYDSPQLSAKEDFTIDLVEAWAVGPPPKKAEEEDGEDAKKSILDKDPEAQALLELVGKGRKSEGLRDEDPMADIPEVHEMPTK